MAKISKAKNALHNLGNRCKRMLRWIKGQHFPPGFDKWHELGVPGPGSGFEQVKAFAEWQRHRSGQTDKSIASEYIGLVTEPGKRWLDLTLNFLDRFQNLDWDFCFPALGSSTDSISVGNTSVWTMHVTGVFKVLKLSNLRVKSCFVEPSKGEIVLWWNNCVIGTLRLDVNDWQGDRNLELHDCWIGTLVVKGGCLKNLTVSGGGIAHIECPSADSDNPFKGSVSFKKVFFPSSPKQTKLFQGSHAYSSLYAHLKKLDNTLMANVMRSHQLRAQRVDEEGFAYVTNWIYDKFSDYGMSPGRPLWWLGVVYILAVICCYNFDYGTLMSSYADTYVGAYAMLLDENGGRLTRSFLLPLHSIINPFGVFFDPRKLFVPTTGFGSILLTIQGLFSDILLVMTALSVRRRFKTE